MAEHQNFRTALHGFNRDDVVQYIEGLNARHNAEVNRLKSDLHYMQEKLATKECSAPVVKAAAAPVVMEGIPESVVEELETKLAQAEEAVRAAEAELQEQLDENRRLQDLLDTALSRQSENRAAVELDIYRRAERVEREARSRATVIYGQANTALTAATTKVDETAGQIAELAEAAMQQIKQLQLAISGSKQVLQDTATTLYSIRPENEE